MRRRAVCCLWHKWGLSLVSCDFSGNESKPVVNDILRLRIPSLRESCSIGGGNESKERVGRSRWGFIKRLMGAWAKYPRFSQT